MMDFSQVTRFEHRLEQASRTDIEPQWADKWGPVAAKRVASAAPRRTGRLAASVFYDDTEIHIGVDYWGYVEFGTSRTPPQPFVRPTVRHLSRPAAEDAGRMAVDQI